MAMNLFLKEVEQLKKNYLSSKIDGKEIMVKELGVLIEVTNVKINRNIKHYNGDKEKATDRFMLNKWVDTISDYYLIFKQVSNIDDFTKKQLRILTNKIQHIATLCE